jgi:hypothetical protein
MVGIGSILIGAVSVIGRIRRAAAAVRTVKDNVQQGAGILTSLTQGLQTAISGARNEVSDLTGQATLQLVNTAAALRQELEELRRMRQPTDTVETQLAAVIQCKADMQKAAADAEHEIRVCEIECAAEVEMCAVQDPAVFPAQPVAPIPEQRYDPLPENVQANFWHEGLRMWGCYFFALLRWAEEIRGNGFGIQNVVRIYEELVHARLVRDDSIIDMRREGELLHTAFILDPVAIINRLVGRQVFTRQLRVRNGESCYIESVKSGRWPHKRLWLNNKVWDSLGGNAANYVHKGVRVLV